MKLIRILYLWSSNLTARTSAANDEWLQVERHLIYCMHFLQLLVNLLAMASQYRTLKIEIATEIEIEI